MQHFHFYIERVSEGHLHLHPSPWSQAYTIVVGRCYPHRELIVGVQLVYSGRMAKTTIDSHLQRYALLGAQARLQQLQEETANIYRTFPQLRTRNGTVGTSTPSESDGPATKRRRSRMSAAQRKAVGERMKKYWAARRDAANGTATSGPSAATTPKRAPKGRRTPKRAKAPAKRGPRKMSAAARKRISDAQKARWAKQKGAAT